MPSRAVLRAASSLPGSSKGTEESNCWRSRKPKETTSLWNCGNSGGGVRIGRLRNVTRFTHRRSSKRYLVALLLSRG
jgi:hypothetical protein